MTSEQSASVFSSQWYRVAKLHPSLRSQVRVTRQIYRDETWYVLADPVSGRFHRMNAAAYAFVGRCDGTRSVDELAEALLADDPDNALTQDEIVRLLVQLNQRGLIQCEVTPDVEAIFHRQHQEKRKERRLGVNPLAFRLRLGDPSAFLERFDPWLRRLVSLPMLLLWLAVVAVGALIGMTHFDDLVSAAHTWMSTPRFLLIAWLLYPPVKAIHELAHGLAIRRFGGEVRQMGISLLLLTPAPYVDASAASALRHSNQRLVVSAAGIMAELFLAALALLVWVTVQPGTVRDVALVVAVIGSVSTALFNGNPLLRFDGYYVLCDSFDLPNLGARSQAFWRHLLLSRVLRLVDVPSPEPGKGERPWLVFYAPAALIYRIGLTVAIVGWIGSWSMVLGVLAGVGMAITLVVKPAVDFWVSLLRMALPERQRRRVLRTAGLVSVMAVGLVGWVPFPFSTLAQGVVWVPEQAQLRVGTDGFIVALEARHGERVEAGQVLARLDDARLVAESARLRSQLEGLDTDLFQAMQRETILDKLIWSKQLELEAERSGVDFTPEQLAEHEAKERRHILDWPAWLARVNQTEALRHQANIDYLRERALLEARVGSLAPSEDELRAAYEAKREQLNAAEPMVRAAHIQLAYGPRVGDEKILRASSIAKIPSGDGLSYGKARLAREATES